MTGAGPLTPLYGPVWCLTCEHEHVPGIPAITFVCSDCGYGGWIAQVAQSHATNYPDHVVYALHHQTVPLAPEPPVILRDYTVEVLPEGWTGLILGPTLAGEYAGPRVLAGWDAAGTFHQYVPTETIVSALLETLEALHA